MRIKILRKLINISVTWKFILAYFAVIILPIIFTGVYLYIQTSDSSISQSQTVMEQNLSQTKASILQKVKIIENVSQIIAFNTKIQTFLDSTFDGEAYQLEDYQYDILPFVEGIMRQNRTIRSIRLYMSNMGIPELYDSFYHLERIERQPWFDTLWKDDKQQSVWRTSHMSQNHIDNTNDTKALVFSYCRKINSVNQYKVGVLVIEVRESILFDILRDPVMSNLGKVFIVDTEGKVVSNNIPELYSKGPVIYGLDNLDITKSNNKVQKVGGEDCIVISVPVEEMGCSIIGLFPVSNFNDKVKSSMTQTIIILVASSILLGFVVFFITTALLSRVKRLVKAMKQVRGGNLDVSVPVTSTDEFGELARTFNHMTSRIHDLVESEYKIRIIEREAELKSLEANINPHFLYNTLATISWAARKADAPVIVNISNALAKFYRLVLSKGNTEIPVRDELEMVKVYMNIQKFRFEDMFDVIYEIDESVYKYNVMKNILQPLIENSLNHGIQPKRGHGTIIINASSNDEGLCFRLIDDGVGIDQRLLEKILSGQIEAADGSGYAVKNIMKRLQAYYGPRHYFDIFSKPGIGTVTTIKIMFLS